MAAAHGHGHNRCRRQVATPSLLVTTCRCQAPPQMCRPRAPLRFRRCLAPGERLRGALEWARPPIASSPFPGGRGSSFLVLRSSFGNGNGLGLGLGTRGSELGTRDSGLGTRDSGFGTRDSGFGIRDSKTPTRPKGVDAVATAGSASASNAILALVDGARLCQGVNPWTTPRNRRPGVYPMAPGSSGRAGDSDELICVHLCHLWASRAGGGFRSWFFDLRSVTVTGSGSGSGISVIYTLHTA